MKSTSAMFRAAAAAISERLGKPEHLSITPDVSWASWWQDGALWIVSVRGDADGDVCVNYGNGGADDDDGATIYLAGAAPVVPLDDALQTVSLWLRARGAMFDGRYVR